ncbi:MAG: mannose-6-phosphate isomerase, class I [Spirochaetales bacterium]|nr:mannose-6-phosphate isomerase, class I [Spirochaetales bacterium]
MALYKIENNIQKYAWGSVTSIPELLGIPNPDKEPMAELWMGAHPKSPSLIVSGGVKTPLNDFIASDPDRVLGQQTSRRFAGRFPFLFKVLAAGSPLSIQAHPSIEQAVAGFARENADGIELDAFNRNYKDDNHKPEIICALTDYSAMRGFREPAEIARNFRKLGAGVLEVVSDNLYNSSPENSETVLREFFSVLMNLNRGDMAEIIEKAIDHSCGRWSERGNGLETEAFWIRRLAKLYPGDIGIISPLFLNIINLKEGQAMYLPAGELHAYLEGLGIELMANSDNVLRGGLTSKHIDLPELLSTLKFTSGAPEVLEAVRITDYESGYLTPAPEFFLSKIEITGGEYKPPTGANEPGLPAIMICTSGTVEFADEDGNQLSIGRGESVFAEYGSRMKISGDGVLFRASVPGA